LGCAVGTAGAARVHTWFRVLRVSTLLGTLLNGWLSCTLVVVPTVVIKLCVPYDICTLDKKQIKLK
jgi:hypothetical protein